MAKEYRVRMFYFERLAPETSYVNNRQNNGINVTDRLRNENWWKNTRENKTR